MVRNKYFIQSLGMGLVISSAGPALAAESVSIPARAQGEQGQMAQLGAPRDGGSVMRPDRPRFDNLPPEQRQAGMERGRPRERDSGDAALREGDARPRPQGQDGSGATTRPDRPRFENNPPEQRRDRMNDLTPEQRQAIMERRRQRDERRQLDGGPGAHAGEAQPRPQGQDGGPPRFRQDIERARGEVYGRPPRR